MDRKQFLKMFGIGATATVAAPMLILSQPDKKAYLPPICYKMDISSIPDGMSIEDVIKEWNRTGMIIYQNKPPERI